MTPSDPPAFTFSLDIIRAPITRRWEGGGVCRITAEAALDDNEGQ